MKIEDWYAALNYSPEQLAVARRVLEEIRGGQDTSQAMRHAPRHLFVPEPHRGEAYEDRPIPIGFGQTISQPYIVAFMTQLLRLDGTETVLEIGTGSGYQAAILAALAKQVHTVEFIPGLAENAPIVEMKKINIAAIEAARRG